MASAVSHLSSEYHDLNGDHIDVLEQPPTALEFSRLVHISRPVLIRGMQIPSVQFWDDEYLAATLGETEISVAVTPNGRADAVTQSPDGKLYFVEPHVESMKMSELLSKLSPEAGDPNIYYLQSQNGNVYSSRFFEGVHDPSEFELLRHDIPSEIPWCSEGLGKSPDAVNLWIGSIHSVTSIHTDPYENIYTVVRGSKHFTLLPPTDGWCLKGATVTAALDYPLMHFLERMYPHGTWTRKSPEEPLTLMPSPNVPPIRWSSVADPDLPGNLPPEAHPIQITIDAGETLYLPPGWWHHVRQSDNTIALNWWYDMEMRGMSWVFLSFLRKCWGRSIWER
ncbi:JmjC domain-containing protein 7 [Mycena sanguinolenta]|uniref:JmjC domain-containing protein 7 n=1 Tax=Mycena sanguinolenta TaxID=230812 RepID=A0A8H6Y6S5_9AGAR|nr:JmjC domain-containing protein 7 [Mycena sanguinolenta]